MQVKRDSWHFRVKSGLPPISIPAVTGVGSDEIISPLYRFEGASRRDHHHVIIQWTISGEGVFEYDRQVFRVPAGHGFICRARDPKCRYYYPKDAAGAWKVFFMELDQADEIADQLHAKGGATFQLPDALNPFTAWLKRPDERQINQFEFSWLNPVTLAVQSLTAIARSREALRYGVEGNPIVRRADELIRNHDFASASLSVSSLAKTLLITPEHLSRLFRESQGIPPTEAIRLERMRQAADWLANSAMSIKEIAHRLGFDTPSHFARNFRQVKQVSPRDYRLCRQTR